MTERLRAVLAAEGGLLAGALRPEGATAPDELAEHVAAGPRAAAAPADYAVLLAAIREGHELHAGAPRIVETADPDLALLAGDRLYALGLDRLAQLGDLDAVAELADVIALCAQALADGDPDLADRAWRAGAEAVGWGGQGAAKVAPWRGGTRHEDD
jgi:hypothetical protein